MVWILTVQSRDKNGNYSDCLVRGVLESVSRKRFHLALVITDVKFLYGEDSRGEPAGRKLIIAADLRL
jgi:hypothetical protein